MKKNKDFITCNTCKKEHFDLFSIETTQAYGCASDVIETDSEIFIYSHYGSKFDTSKFQVLKKDELQLGIICDECIEKSINNDFLKEDENYNYFDFIPDSHEETPKLVQERFWKENIDFGDKK